MTDVRSAEMPMADDRSEHDLGRVVLDRLPVLAAYLDRNQRYRFVNQAYGDFFGLVASTVVGMRMSEVLGPELYASVVEEIEGALAGVPRDFERTAETPHGARRVRVRYLPDVVEGEVHGVIVQTLDITESHRASMALVRAEERFRTLFEAAPTATLLTDDAGLVVAANTAAATLLGRPRDELEGRPAITLIHPDEYDSAVGISRLLFGEGTTSYSGERRYLRPDGTTVWAQADITRISATTDEDDTHYLLAQLQDIGARKRYEAQLEFLADHDALTGLLNRRGFQSALEAQAWVNRTAATEAVVIVLDLDNFKMVNDVGGHDAGDRLLIEVATVLRSTLTSEAVIARLGGDEFAVILPGPLGPFATRAAAAVVAEVDRVTAATARDEGWPGRHITASVGVAAFTRDLTGDRALTAADQAMYRAKKAGRNRFSE